MSGNKTSRKSIKTNQKLEQKIESLKKQLGEREKELSCIYKISQLVESEDNISGIIKGTTNILADSWQYPDITCVKIKLNSKEYKADNYKETKWIQKPYDMMELLKKIHDSIL